MTEQAFLLDQSHANLLVDRSTPRSLVSAKMSFLAAGTLLGTIILFFPAGLFLYFGLTEGEWDAGKVTFIATLFIVPAFMILMSTPAMIREYKLIRHGQVILGEVVSSKTETSTHFNQATHEVGESTWTETVITVDYAFVSPSGSRISGTAQQKIIDADQPHEPKPGEAMAVLFLDDELHKAL